MVLRRFITGEPFTIPLAGGGQTVVSPEDYMELAGFRWRALKTKNTLYAVTKVSGQTVLMHRVVARALAGQVVDHADQNGLNNKRCNLRIATHAQNGANSRDRPGGSSKYRGVYWNKDQAIWMVRCGGDYVGRFCDEADAALAYDRAAVRAYGEFARINGVS